MTRFSHPSKIDWIIVISRWVFILAVSIWINLGISLNLEALIILVMVSLTNIGVMVLYAFGFVNPLLRLLFAIGDFFIAQIWFFTSLGSGQELIWLSFLPLVSASLYFQWLGALLVIFLNTIVQGFLLFLTTAPEKALLKIGIILPVSVLISLGLIYASSRGDQLNSSKKKGQNLDQGANSHLKDRVHRQTFYALISELSATLNHQKVLETSLNLANSAMAELGGGTLEFTSAIVLFSGDNSNPPMLNIAASRNLKPEDMNVVLPGIRGALVHVIDEGSPSLVKEPKTDPELRQISALRACRSAFLLPLRMGMDAYGVLIFAHPDSVYFSDDRCEVLEIIRNQTSIALQNSLLYQELELERNRLLEIQEESRHKLARDLHDGPTQAISAIAMRVNFVRRLMDRDLKTAAEELYKIEDLARKTTKEIRHMLFTLRPLVLETQGLVAALESMADKMNETYSQEVAIQADARFVELLETAKQAVIFYIVEEAVNNARKHAQARHIWVRLKMLGEGLGQLEIEDDGSGFDINAVDTNYANRGSLGLINLRERAEHINGVLQIESAIGQGTRVRVLIPLTEEAADRLRRGG